MFGSACAVAAFVHMLPSRFALLPCPTRAVAMFAYLLNTASSLLAASGPAAKRVEAIQHKLEVGLLCNGVPV